MRIILGCLAAAAVLAAGPVWAETGYLDIHGVKQGAITAGGAGRSENRPEVLNVDFGITVPQNLGVATGRRSLQPVTFTLHWDRTAPMLFNAATTGEVLQVTYAGYAPNAEGVTKQTHSLQLINARVVSFKIVDSDGSDGKLDPVVVVGMTADKVTLTDSDSGTTATDDWNP